MLDEEHEHLKQDESDNNLCSLRRIGDHNVVIVCPPAGLIGNNPATAVATQMRSTFRLLRFGLMVGIGGGVPSAEADIRLGDVVVNQPHQGYGGVVQYDFGKATPKGLFPGWVSQLPAADTTRCGCKDASEPPSAKEQALGTHLQASPPSGVHHATPLDPTFFSKHRTIMREDQHANRAAQTRR